MKALSIQQPWAWAIFHGKPVENRTWKSAYRGPLLIHAAKTFDHVGYHWLSMEKHLLTAPLPCVSSFPRGGIIGKVGMINCVKEHPSPFFFGPYGFVYEEQKEIPFIPYRGKLGFFDVPEEIANKSLNRTGNSGV